MVGDVSLNELIQKLFLLYWGEGGGTALQTVDCVLRCSGSVLMATSKCYK